jgi:hypothetical protein
MVDQKCKINIAENTTNQQPNLCPSIQYKDPKSLRIKPIEQSPEPIFLTLNPIKIIPKFILKIAGSG